MSLLESAHAVQRTWTGSVNGNWSNPNNWSPAGAPSTGDALFFTGGSNRSMSNDFSSLIVSELMFTGADFDVKGGLIVLDASYGSGWIWTQGSSYINVTINCSVYMQSDVSLVILPDFGGGGKLRMNGFIEINSHTLQASSLGIGGAPASKIEIAGPLYGAGEIVVKPNGTSNGTIEFLGTADNSFSGTMRVIPSGPGGVEGVYFSKTAGSVVTNRLQLEGGTIVDWKSSNQLGDYATVVVTDGSLLRLNGYNDTIGSLILTNTASDSSASRVDTAGGLLSVLGNVSSWNASASVIPAVLGKLDLPSGEHTFNIQSYNVYGGLDVQAQISGFGNFYKTGGATLLLQGSNSFNANITIDQGPLEVRNDHGLGDAAGTTVIGAGSLVLRDVNIADEWLIASGVGVQGELPGSVLTSFGSSSWSGQVALNTNLVVNGNMAFTGYIYGTGGLGCFGPGTIFLGGTVANTFTGPTLVRCPLLELDKSFAVNAYAGSLSVGQDYGGPQTVRWLNSYQTPNTPTTLYATGVLDLNGEVETFGPVTFNGGSVETGSGAFLATSFITANAANNTAVIRGNLSLGVSPYYFYVSNGVAQPALQIDAVIAGGNLAKDGQGTLKLTGTNTYSGATFVEEGILYVDNPSALGTLGNETYLSDGATIRLGAVDGMAEGFNLVGNGFQGTNGALDVVSGGKITGPITLLGNSTIKVEQGAGLQIASSIYGTGPLTKTGAGSLYLGAVAGDANPNFYSGTTFVSAGTLYLAKNQNVNSVPGNLVLGPSTLAAPAIAILLNTGLMPAGGTATVNANSVLNLFGNNQTLSQLTLNDGGTAQTGGGTLSFTGGGLVTIGTLNSFPPGLRNGATISGRIGLPANDNLTFNVTQYGPAPLTSNPELAISAVIAGAGNFAKNGFGAMLLSGNNTFDGAGVGELDVLSGTVIVGSAGALGGTNGVTYVGNGASLALINGITINNETLYLDSTASPSLDNRGGFNTWNGPMVLNRNSTIGVAQDWMLAILGVISGPSSLTKIGAGTLVLGGTADNKYAGDTFVNEGTLNLSKSAWLQAVPANLIVGQTNGATTAISRHYNLDQIWANTTVNHGGLLDLNGFDEYIGVLTLNGGGDVQTGNGTIYLATNVTVNPGSFGDPSIISGRLGLYPLGISTGLVPFLINSGSPATNNPDCLVSATIVQNSVGAGIQKSGTGVLRLTGTNVYTGSNVVSGGTFWVDGQQPQTPVNLNAGTTLKGSGTIGAVNILGSSVTISPGSSAGILTTSNFNAGAAGAATLRMELNGTNAGGGYDQLNVRGSVNLTGVSLAASVGFASSVSNQFTIINNDGSDAVAGTFSGLPQGATLYIGSELFQISYTGGSGNDVVLSRQVTPPPPKLTAELIAGPSVRLTWPTNNPPFRLQATTNLNGGIWVSSTLPAILTGTNLVAKEVLGTTTTNPVNYYRLISP